MNLNFVPCWRQRASCLAFPLGLALTWACPAVPTAQAATPSAPSANLIYDDSLEAIAAYGCDEVVCGEGCGDACGGCGDGIGCGAGCGAGLLGGLLKPSDHAFDDFISPMTNPIFFEDPRTLTEARGIFLQHKVPATALGGDVQLYAMQFRAALTDRLSLIAAKDGFIVSQNPLIADGWADVDLGLKYNLIRNVADQRLLSAGIVYDMPVGSPRALQARGDGDFHLFLTGGAEVLGYGHVISASGFRLPANTALGSQMWYWSNHLDYEVFDNWYALAEFNWFHWMKSGNDPTLDGVEGFDIINLGSTGVAGNDIVTGAFGAKYKPSGNMELGIAWELPLTERRDILENRLTVDLILRY